MTHVVIIGAGFAGLEAAKRLRHAPVRQLALISSVFRGIDLGFERSMCFGQVESALTRMHNKNDLSSG